MSKLTDVSETLFVPMEGRVYSSRNCPKFFYDSKALEIYENLPENLKSKFEQDEYTYIASAMRSKNLDLYIKDFLNENPEGSIINLGCGMESLYERNDNQKANWFELDFPEVLKLRKNYLPPKTRDNYLPYSMFDYAWIDEVKKISDKSKLIIAAGLFHYFEEEQIVEFINNLQKIAPAYLVFDAVSTFGLKQSQKYMKKMNREDALMYFSVDDPNYLINKCSSNIKLLRMEKYYKYANYNSNLKFSTKIKMKVSDIFNMVKMIYLKIES
ncbi:MAG: class I SAM-dependent methyltransferase [Tissierellia bacterium]|nr:class I SAM-dependent methyltransferase [Tissierellia bacterium]